MSDFEAAAGSGSLVRDVPTAEPGHKDALTVYKLVEIANTKIAHRPTSDAIAELIDHAASTERLWPPVKLLLLAYLKGGDIPHDLLMPMATSLVMQGPAGKIAGTAKDLLNTIGTTTTTDPLHRQPADFVKSLSDAEHSEGMQSLWPSISNTLITITPQCTASKHPDHGSPAMYVETSCFSNRLLSEFVPLVDPFDWTKCALMHFTFRDMTAASPRTALKSPDHGWEQTILETVTLPFGPQPLIKTNLDFRFAHEEEKFVGSTFKMSSSEGDIFTRDQGFLLAQDLAKSPGVDARKFTTTKAVWFADTAFNYPGPAICSIWSIASALLMHSCLGAPEQEPSDG